MENRRNANGRIITDAQTIRMSALSGQSDGGIIDPSFPTGAFLPAVAVGVNQLQPLFHLLQPDAMAASVSVTFGMVGVLDVAENLVAPVADTDMYKTGFGGADAMFERILYQ